MVEPLALTTVLSVWTETTLPPLLSTVSVLLSPLALVLKICVEATPPEGRLATFVTVCVPSALSVWLVATT